MAAPVARRQLLLPDERATARLAQDVAASLKVGDLVALYGGLGAGKTTFARALLRALAGDPLLEVQSPTFPLRIDHALPRIKVVHADLYRISAAAEIDELGLEEALGDSVLLVEWPERLPEGLSDERLDLRFEIDGTGRRVEVVGTGTWPERLNRSFAIRAFLERSGWGGAIRVPLAGDASYRAYEKIGSTESYPLPIGERSAERSRGRVRGPMPDTPSPVAFGDTLSPVGRGNRSSGRGTSTAILMNSPARVEGPPIYHGRSYDAVAHRSMDVRAFVAIGNALRDAGIRAPEIFAADMDAGLLLLEDLGGEGIVDPSGAPILERYEAAIDLLIFMHGRTWPIAPLLPDGSRYLVPPYDREALLVEISLFPDWFGGYGGEPAFPKERREEFLGEWSKILATIEGKETTWTLRDFHSPNILWQQGETGLSPVGVIDFQDALIGHPAYDVASLAQDARVPLSAEEESRLKDRYIAGRKAADPTFDEEGLSRAYSILGLQRATKVLGIFTRLALAEGKPGYQKHRARLKALIRRNLSDPVLSPLRVWYEPYL